MERSPGLEGGGCYYIRDEGRGLSGDQNRGLETGCRPVDPDWELENISREEIPGWTDQWTARESLDQ